MGKVELIGPSENMTVEQALNYVMKEDLTDVYILGYDQEGRLINRSSQMSNEQALFMLCQAQLQTLGR